MTNTELREKLVELLIKIDGECPKEGHCYECEYDVKPYCHTYGQADSLIANGVTFGKDTDVPNKWISASEPPKDWKGEGGYLTNYYVYTPEYGTDIGNYMGPAYRWLCMGVPCNVTHWMPLPTPPKEE